MNDSVILGYHRILESPQADPISLGLQVSTARFRQHLEVLARRFSVVSLQDLTERLVQGSSIDGTAALTLDDGYADNYQYAFPILSQMGLPATIFLATDNIDRGQPYWTDRVAAYLSKTAGAVVAVPAELGSRLDLTSPERTRQSFEAVRAKLAGLEDPRRREQLLDALGAEEPADSRPLTWEEIRSMHRGGIAFGAHTRSHPSLVALSAPSLRMEIDGSRDVIAARLGAAPVVFAYPFGHVDARVAQAVAAAGFSGAVTTRWPTRGTAWSPLHMPRLMVDDMPSAAFVHELDVLQGHALVVPPAHPFVSRLKAAIPRPVAGVLRSVRSMLITRP